MKTFHLAIGLFATPLTVIAAPAWTMVAYNTSFPALHGQSITAYRGAFWLNNPIASAVCPSYDPSCSAANATIIPGPVYGDGGAAQSEYWFMGVLQAGGQQMSTWGADNTFGGQYLEYAAVGAPEIGVAFPLLYSHAGKLHWVGRCCARTVCA